MYSYGKLIGTRTVYNDRLLMFMLRNRAPERFTGGKPNALNVIDQMELTRHKQHWRKEWEREAAQATIQRGAQTTDSLIERITLMHQRWFCQLGPQARAAYRQFRQCEADEASAARDARWAATDLEIARTDLAEATDPDDADDARHALSQAELAHATGRSAIAQAEAEYAEWFTDERRATVWRAIDVVFGVVSAVDGAEGAEGDDGAEEAP